MSSYKKFIERKNKEEEETAHAFQEFIDTFQNANPTSKTFIKSGIYNPGSSRQTDDEKGKFYNPLPIVKGGSYESHRKAMECARLVKDNRFDKGKTFKPKSNLELLKEELRLRHLDRDCRQRVSSRNTDSHLETIDTTTNLFLTNLNPKLVEQDLMHMFGIYGPLASVKIMWPRSDERTRSTNIGFVAYMSRKDSERAFNLLGNRDDMRVSWGKPIEIPSQPVYIPPELVKMMLPPPYSGLPFNAQPMTKTFTFPDNDNQMHALLGSSIVKVTIPLDKKMLMNIHRVIEFVIREGPMFEAIIMHKEMNNPSFQFLFDNKSSQHIYYRWKLFSLMNGEGISSWSSRPFRMFKGGSIWIPPTIPDYTKGMIDKPKADFQNLSDNQQFRFIQIIKQLNLSKAKIAEATVFCLKHSEACRDIVNILCESFDNSLTSAVKKTARLYLVSDLLYNTKLKRGILKGFNDLLQAKLVKIFEHLEITLRTTAYKDNFKSRVMKVLRAWEMWRVYPNDFLDKLDATFIGENFDDSGDEPLDGKILLTRSMNCPMQPEVTVVMKKEEVTLDNFVPAKWETLDPLEIESQAMSAKKIFDIESARLEAERQQRDYEKLRRIELKVLKYQDDLESGKRKLKKRRSIDEEVNEYRRRSVEKLKRTLETSPISSDSFSSDDSIEKRSKRKRREKKRRY